MDESGIKSNEEEPGGTTTPTTYGELTISETEDDKNVPSKFLGEESE
jgi:hypothetical protein